MSINAEEIIIDTINKFGVEALYQCVNEINLNNIVFEYQFPFLSHMYMKNENIEILKQIFEQYGFDAKQNLHALGFPINGEYKYCACIFGDIIENIDDVKMAFDNYYK